MDLKEAIAAGLRLREEEEDLRKQQAVDKVRKEEAERAERVEMFKRRIPLEAHLLYDHITKAVASRKRNASIPDMDQAFAEAVNSIPGMHASHSSGEDHINSDEVKEFWQRVTVTWD